MKEYIAEVFSEEKYKLGESPFYDQRTKTISWVDIIAGKFYRQKDDRVTEFDCGQPLGTALPAKKAGTYVLAATDGLYLFDGEKMTLIKDLSKVYKSYQRSNDAKADSAGRLWFGSSLLDGSDHQPCGNLYRLDSKDAQIKIMQANTKISNGMAWSSDRKKFYFSDTLEHAVFVYDYDFESASISNRKVLFSIPRDQGLSDGMCIDSEDNLWVAFWGGSRIEKRSGIDGSLLATVKVDAKNVTSCCFIGENLDTLFITTSGNGQTSPHDGCLFTAKVDAKGLESDYANF